MPACPQCAVDNPADARFCNQCGTRLAATPEPARSPGYTPRHLAERILKERAALRGEKKRVTVLFCDIKGSTRLAQQAGAEKWHVVLDRFFALLGAAVHRYQGTINQYTGDGIMALFGAPLALEDHAQQACFAALEMQHELRRFADELRLSQGLNLSLRVGLNSGEVIVGAIGDDLRMDYTAQGHTVNLAARMEHICEPGHVYLTRATARLVEGYFTLRPLGCMTVAGVDEPVEVFDLEGQGHARTRLQRTLARGETHFIGREPEMAALADALERVRAGEGQVIAVTGEAGIGKSRLCHEFAAQAERASVEVHRASGMPHGAALPLHPIHTLALSRMGLADRTDAGEIRRLVAGMLMLEHPEHAAALPAILDFLGAGDGQPQAPEQAASLRAQLFELLAQYLPCPRPAAAGQPVRPLLLLVEDLHFLDPASRELLQQLVPRVTGYPTLLLLNYRPDYDDGWLRGHLHARIAVEPMAAPQLRALAALQLGAHESVGTLAETLGERAGGNPYFVEEAILALAESGSLQGSPGHYRLTAPIARWVIPDDVHALLAARIDRLPEARKRLLQMAAVIGEPFGADPLASLAAQEPAEVAAHLQTLFDAGFLRREDESHYDFRHALLREVADSQQLETDRAAHHARLAALLQAAQPAGGSPGRVAVRIAHHWQHAGDWARAGEWNLIACRWANNRDIRIAIEQFQLALDHLDRAPETPAVIRLRIAARATLVRMAPFTPIALANIERAYDEGRRMAAAVGDVAGEAELAISYGNELLRRGDAQAAARHHAEAVALCLVQGLPTMVTRFRLNILLCHFSAGLPRAGLALVDSADNGRWRQTAIDEDNFASRGFHALLLAWLGDATAARAEIESVLAFCARDARDTSWMHAFRVDLAWIAGDTLDVLHHARLAVHRAEQSGSDYFRAIGGRAMALALCMSGRAPEAVTVMEALTPITAPGGLAHHFEANHLATLARAYCGSGRFVEALHTAEAAIASAQRSGSRVWEINAWLALLDLPETVLEPTRAGQGLLRLGDLLVMSGAEGFRPFWQRLATRWAPAAERVQA
jgi:class 3 adenylate cyclase/tetratricopeptide (TPR) repeat protein